MEAIHMYSLYENGKLEGIYSEEQLAERFEIAVTTLRFNVTNDRELAPGYTAKIAEDKILKEKGRPTDPEMILLLKEWDEIRKLFLRK